MMLRQLALGAVLALAGTPLFAHPHSNVNQQVALTLWADRVAADIVIVPSDDAGPSIFSRLDADANGAVSTAEARAFAHDVIARTSTHIAGEHVQLRVNHVSVTDPAALQAGLGVIVISAAAPIDLRGATLPALDFSIGFEEFAHDWFIQPYVAQDSLPVAASLWVEREGENSISVAFHP